ILSKPSWDSTRGNSPSFMPRSATTRKGMLRRGSIAQKVTPPATKSALLVSVSKRSVSFATRTSSAIGSEKLARSAACSRSCTAESGHHPEGKAAKGKHRAEGASARHEVGVARLGLEALGELRDEDLERDRLGEAGPLGGLLQIVHGRIDGAHLPLGALLV